MKRTYGTDVLLLFLIPLVVVLSQTKSKSPLAHRKSNTIGERFMVKEESAASVGTRPWTLKGRRLTLSIEFMLHLGLMEWPSRLGRPFQEKNSRLTSPIKPRATPHPPATIRQHNSIWGGTEPMFIE
ncbi:hypothetical protein AVEN_214895-1 [Araneus ventricosus]|uniref:Secreted protein n=1 Tax=Araneus ventricosus TaxID=182803 RepID=A0A4Y2KXD1_ARAVE|nr:hypothetical protein AVEN_214895-1 [Araneus ventricosus]